ncbi:MAG: DMT family transporter [Candidatus Thorarchaeota archaeon]|nr:DMT family transporter [Candidatus Thorarchaeota archaeon]
MSSKRPYLLLATIILLWGANFVVSRFLSGIDPVRVSGVFYALFRYLFGALTMIFVMLYQKQGLTEIGNEIRPYRSTLLLSAFFSSIFVIAIHTSTEFVSSGTTSIIVNLCPILVLVYGVFYLKERVTLIKATGFLLGVIGGLIFLWNSFALAPGLELGIFLAVIGMVAWGAYTVTLHYLEGANRYIVMTVKHAVSTLMILPIIAFMILEGSQLILIFDAWSIAGLLFAGVFASGLAYVLYFSAIEILGAPKASSFLFLVPFVSVIGDFVLGEPPAIITLFAGSIALIGVALVRFSSAAEMDSISEKPVN